MICFKLAQLYLVIPQLRPKKLLDTAILLMDTMENLAISKTKTKVMLVNPVKSESQLPIVSRKENVTYVASTYQKLKKMSLLNCNT